MFKNVVHASSHVAGLWTCPHEVVTWGSETGALEEASCSWMAGGVVPSASGSRSSKLMNSLLRMHSVMRPSPVDVGSVKCAADVGMSVLDNGAVAACVGKSAVGAEAAGVELVVVSIAVDTAD